jgi:uncharacterized protein (TIGR00369 family)
MALDLKHPGGFDALLGHEILELSEERATSQVRVGPQHLQPMGLVHGGVYAAIAESLTSLATNLAVMDEGQVGVGLSNQTSFLRPILSGTIHAVATRRHRGRSTWVWEVEMRDDAGRLAVITRMTIAVRPAPERPSADGGAASDAPPV